MMHAAAVLLALSLCAGASPEEDRKKEARTYFDAGKQAYASGDYLSAARAFAQANELLPNAAIVFSMAQSYRLQFYIDRKSEHLHRAVELYRRYLSAKGTSRKQDAVEHLATLEPLLRAVQPPGEEAQPPPKAPTQLMITSRTPGVKISIDGVQLGESPVIKEVKPGEHSVTIESPGYFPESLQAVAVEERLIVVELNLKPKPAQIEISAPKGATISIDGRPVGKAPLVRPLEIEAGRHALSVSKMGSYIYSRDLNLERGETKKLNVELETTTQRTTSYYFLVGGGGILLATGVVVAIALVSEGQARLIIRKRDQMMMNLTELERDDYIKARDRRNDLLAASSASLVGGTLITAVGILLFTLDSPQVMDPEEESDATALIPMPAVSPEYVGAQWSLRF